MIEPASSFQGSKKEVFSSHVVAGKTLAAHSSAADKRLSTLTSSGMSQLVKLAPYHQQLYQLCISIGETESCSSYPSCSSFYSSSRRIIDRGPEFDCFHEPSERLTTIITLLELPFLAWQVWFIARWQAYSTPPLTSSRRKNSPATHWLCAKYLKASLSLKSKSRPSQSSSTTRRPLFCTHARMKAARFLNGLWISSLSRPSYHLLAIQPLELHAIS